MAYLLSVQLAFTALCLLYALLLRRERHFQLNRLVLLAATVLPFVLPLLTLPWGADAGAGFPTVDTLVARPLAVPAATSTAELTPGPDYRRWLPLLYWAVAAALVLRVLVGLLLTLFRLRRAPRLTAPVPHRRLPGVDAPCSFFGYLVLPTTAYAPARLRRILVHENVHRRQWHGLDSILVELAAALLWANPLVYLHRRWLRANLEFIADRATVRACGNARAYQLDLLATATAPPPRFVLPYKSPRLKTRITMMNAKPKSRFTILKYLAILPVLYFFLPVTYDHGDYDSTDLHRHHFRAHDKAHHRELHREHVVHPGKHRRARGVYVRIAPFTSREDLESLRATLAEYGCRLTADRLRYNGRGKITDYKFTMVSPEGNRGSSTGRFTPASEGVIFYYERNRQSGVAGNYDGSIGVKLAPVAKRLFESDRAGVLIVTAGGGTLLRTIERR